ncbi:hypothetical protein ELY33_17030 [Vreelandella andesensis]|uniref:Uncharacterized protein n=1 Tax=Vreelandella andesensis TaxID=447567 RepID=A0A433KF84_9GAMM|nr:hypothetical protein [Halomonas andesensis]RUR26811.1 hypothetical protein ELY33_17030 [Halomonas andesensis]
MTVAQHFPVQGWSLGLTVDRFMQSDFQDGDLVSHDWLRWALDINDQAVRENEFILLERMDALKTTLLHDHQIALQNVRGRGYRLVPPSEQARYAAEEVSRYMSKGLRKANSLLTHTRLNQLDTDERRRHTDTEIRVAALSGMVEKGNRDVFALFKASQ